MRNVASQAEVCEQHTVDDPKGFKNLQQFSPSLLPRLSSSQIDINTMLLIRIRSNDSLSFDQAFALTTQWIKLDNFETSVLQ